MIESHVYAGAAVVAAKKMSKTSGGSRDSRDVIGVIAISFRARDWRLSIAPSAAGSCRFQSQRAQRPPPVSEQLSSVTGNP